MILERKRKAKIKNFVKLSKMKFAIEIRGFVEGVRPLSLSVQPISLGYDLKFTFYSFWKNGRVNPNISGHAPPLPHNGAVGKLKIGRSKIYVLH